MGPTENSNTFLDYNSTSKLLGSLPRMCCENLASGYTKSAGKAASIEINVGSVSMFRGKGFKGGTWQNIRLRCCAMRRDCYISIGLNIWHQRGIVVRYIRLDCMVYSCVCLGLFRERLPLITLLGFFFSPSRGFNYRMRNNILFTFTCIFHHSIVFSLSIIIIAPT